MGINERQNKIKGASLQAMAQIGDKENLGRKLINLKHFSYNDGVDYNPKQP